MADEEGGDEVIPDADWIHEVRPPYRRIYGQHPPLFRIRSRSQPLCWILSTGFSSFLRLQTWLLPTRSQRLAQDGSQNKEADIKRGRNGGSHSAVVFSSTSRTKAFVLLRA